MKKLVYIGVVLSLLMLSGCSQLKNVGFKSYNNSFTRNLKAHTKSVTLYRDFTTVAMAQATKFNKPLMKQYIEYTQNIDTSKTTKYQKLLNEFDKYDIYWLAFYTPDDEINNLSSKNSFWNVYELKGSKIYNAIKIKEVGTNNMIKQWLYFVNANRWARQYIIKFRKGQYKKNRHIHLVLSSFLGIIDMAFIR